MSAIISHWDLLTYFNKPVSHDKVSPMKNPPRGGNIILCKFLSPYADLAYPMTKSPPPLKFRRSRRYTIAPREVFAPTSDRFLDDAVWSRCRCRAWNHWYHARQRQRVVLQRDWSRSWMEQNNFNLMLVAHLHNRQWLHMVPSCCRELRWVQLQRQGHRWHCTVHLLLGL